MNYEGKIRELEERVIELERKIDILVYQLKRIANISIILDKEENNGNQTLWTIR